MPRGALVVTVPCDSPFLPARPRRAPARARSRRDDAQLAVAKTGDAGRIPVFCLMRRDVHASLRDFLACGPAQDRPLVRARSRVVEVAFDDEAGRLPQHQHPRGARGPRAARREAPCAAHCGTPRPPLPRFAVAWFPGLRGHRARSRRSGASHDPDSRRSSRRTSRSSFRSRRALTAAADRAPTCASVAARWPPIPGHAFAGRAPARQRVRVPHGRARRRLRSRALHDRALHALPRSRTCAATCRTSPTSPLARHAEPRPPSSAALDEARRGCCRREARDVMRERHAARRRGQDGRIDFASKTIPWTPPEPP